MSSPIVSIVMPTYNVAEYLPEAIDSVLSQTFVKWELLIVNDGSTDDSGKIADDYSKKDNRIKVLNKENGGLSDARNYGLKRASGKYIHFFDSDDAIQPDFYENLLNAISDGNYDFVICGYYKDVIDKNGMIKSYGFSYQNLHHPYDLQNNFHKYYDFLFNYAWNKIFKLDFLISNNLFYQNGLNVIEDKEFMSRVIKFNPSFCILDYYGYRYKLRVRPTLSNNFTSDFITLHLKGVRLQADILRFFCIDTHILNNELFKCALFSCVWMIHCIVKKCQASKKVKFGLISKITNDETVIKNLSSKSSCKLKYSILRNLILRKRVSVIYYLFKFFN